MIFTDSTCSKYQHLRVLLGSEFRTPRILYVFLIFGQTRRLGSEVGTQKKWRSGYVLYCMYKHCAPRIKNTQSTEYKWIFVSQ